MTEINGVVPALGQALSERGYSELTPVQKAVLGSEIGESDALVSAQTGSGKTVAFGIALAPTLLGEAVRFQRGGAPLALIVAPTRELALQIKREFEWLYQHTGAVLASCVGGMDMRAERRMLAQGAHIVIGTPGRLRDHLQRTSLDTSMLKAVVLDEADEMLDLGFRDDLEFILEATPAERRTLLFSATVPRTIGNLAKKFQRDAVRIETAGEAKQHLDISYRALEVAAREKENAIINVLRFYEAKNALVFCNTRAAVNHMTARFNNRGFSVVALSGELSQGERTQALQAMRDGRARVCIATDVAARGIDLPNLELVIHADLPSNSETLLHRSGRTGRAGRKGVSALIVPPSGRRKAERLLSGGRIQATWARPPSVEEVMQKDNERLLGDAALSEPVQQEEQTVIADLMSRYSTEQIAAAFVRLHRDGKSSPEELQAIEPHRGTDRESRPERRVAKSYEPFGESVWFSLSVGRKQNAEPRWLIPLLCKAGDITKREIGSIKMQNEETYVELNADCVDKFVSAIGPHMKLEKSIVAKRLEGVPANLNEPRKPYVRKKKVDVAKAADKSGWAQSPPTGVMNRKARRRLAQETAEQGTGGKAVAEGGTLQPKAAKSKTRTTKPGAGPKKPGKRKSAKPGSANSTLKRSRNKPA